VSISWAGKRMAGTDGERTYAAAAELAVKLGIAEHWEWLGERNDISQLMADHEALVHPSFVEGTANAICEALSSARPVLASDVADHKELIGRANAGFLFDPKDHRSIAAALHRFAALSLEERLAMGQRARVVAENQLSIDRYIDEYERLFLTLVNRRSNGAS
jgi:glycosyltransferase involved in cell wall biosynthesis